ncbi:MAG: DUF805 domain-containing protein [Bacteroidales bacterium]|jgi:uncharacterized membrane protein YhaH (DUF805 family)|nr:DUF805 domain-containing protein [Bacteroidales bacterium]MBR0313534.1 DUF805 domain-containing protein [Bacteroidales bacterium]MBR6972228.1 DUF805 domain-containing protein [Bacteroidales bacterium]
MANALPQLDFMQAIKLAWSRVKETTGRSRRSEFWWAMLVLCVGGGIVGAILRQIPYIGFWLYLIIYIGILVISLPLFMRRMHDVGKGDGLVKAYAVIFACYLLVMFLTWLFWHIGWAATFITGFLTILVSIALAVIGIILIVNCAQDGKPEANEWGPSPKYVDGPAAPETPAQ